jgi:hypothetical protein
MKHPNEATLALHAGEDLGIFARWRVGRHVSRCERCRDEVEAFSALREIVPDLAEIPEVPWNRLAAEMRANIRLGLAAGECVRPTEKPLRETALFTRARAAVALASVSVLVVTGLLIQHPVPMLGGDHMEVQHTANAVEVGQGGHTFRLVNASGAANVSFSANAEGSVGARYVDPDTGYVTVNNVYAQ